MLKRLFYLATVAIVASMFLAPAASANEGQHMMMEHDMMVDHGWVMHLEDWAMGLEDWAMGLGDWAMHHDMMMGHDMKMN